MNLSFDMSAAWLQNEAHPCSHTSLAHFGSAPVVSGSPGFSHQPRTISYPASAGCDRYFPAAVSVGSGSLGLACCSHIVLLNHLPAVSTSAAHQECIEFERCMKTIDSQCTLSH